MPEPGSHAYDVQRRGLRDQYDQQGVPDASATQAANEQLQGGERTGSAAMATERAAGPAGERSGGGDPGPVLELRSSAFSDGDLIPARYSRPGENVPPPLEWSDVPDGTAELALIVEDPDAPRGTFVHWALTGIPPQTRSIEESEPAGVSVWRNDFGGRGYDGPQPPVGDDPHRYFFRLCALAEPLDIGPEAGVHRLREQLEGRKLAVGTLMGRFAR